MIGCLTGEFESNTDELCVPCRKTGSKKETCPNHDGDNTDSKIPRLNYLLALRETKENGQGNFSFEEYKAESLKDAQIPQPKPLSPISKPYQPVHEMENAKQKTKYKVDALLLKPQWRSLLPQEQNCEYCDNVFTNSQEIEFHLRNVHKVKIDDNMREEIFRRGKMDPLVLFLAKALSDDSYANSLFACDKKIMKALYPLYRLIVKNPRILNFKKLRWLQFQNIKFLSIDHFFGIPIPKVSWFPRVNCEKNFLKTDWPELDAYLSPLDSKADLKKIQDQFESLNEEKNQGKTWSILEQLQRHCHATLENMLKHMIKVQNTFFEFQEKLAKLTQLDLNRVSPYSYGSFAQFLQVLLQHYALKPAKVYSVRNAYTSNIGKTSSEQHKFEHYIKFKHKHKNHDFRSGLVHPFGPKKAGHRILDYFFEDVDGTLQAVEYDSCYHHGDPDIDNCEELKNKDINNLAGGLSNDELIAKTQKRAEDIKALFNINVKNGSSCHWKREMEENEDFQKLYNSKLKWNNNHSPHRLVPQSGCFGGKLDVYVHKWEKHNSSQVMKWKDYCSFYPSLLRSMAMPTGKYDITLEADNINELIQRDGERYVFNDSNLECFGIALVDILAPENCDQPILPWRNKNNVVQNCLCATCSNEQSTKPCRHQPKARQLHGVWTLHEIAWAVQNQQYEVKRFYETWTYREHSKIFSAFFDAYASIALRYKIPSKEEERSSFCDQVNEEMEFNEDLKIHPNHYDEDSFMSSLMKLASVSVIGRLNMKTDDTKTVIVDTKEELDKLFDERKIKGIEPLDDEQGSLAVEISTNTQRRDSAYNNNILAMYCYSFGRIKIQKLIEELKQNCSGIEVYYVDTDCVGYIHDESETYVPKDEGVAWGKVRDDIRGATYQNYVAFSPKQYCLIYSKDNNQLFQSAKICGLNLERESTSEVSFEDLEKLLNEETEVVPVTQVQEFQEPNQTRIEECQKNITLRNIYRRRIYEPGNFISRAYGSKA